MTCCATQKASIRTSLTTYAYAFPFCVHYPCSSVLAFTVTQRVLVFGAVFLSKMTHGFWGGRNERSVFQSGSTYGTNICTMGWLRCRLLHHSSQQMLVPPPVDPKRISGVSLQLTEPLLQLQQQFMPDISHVPVQGTRELDLAFNEGKHR